MSTSSSGKQSSNWIRRSFEAAFSFTNSGKVYRQRQSKPYHVEDNSLRAETSVTFASTGANHGSQRVYTFDTMAAVVAEHQKDDSSSENNNSNSNKDSKGDVEGGNGVLEEGNEHESIESDPKNVIPDLPHHIKPRRTEGYTPKVFDIWAMGITTVIGGQFYGWMEGFHGGFATYLIAQVLVGIAFLILVCSICEIVSTVSFSGGSYGMARVVLGFYPGFLVAGFELMEYISYTSVSALFLGQFICAHAQCSDNFGIPLVICIAFYVISYGFLIEGKAWFWRLNYLLAVLTLTIFLIYCFGSLPYTNMKYVHIKAQNPDGNDTWFAGRVFAFMRLLPYCTWGFGGVEATALVTDIVPNARQIIPQGMLASTATLFVCMILVTFVAGSLPPGIGLTRDTEYFMDIGFSSMGVSKTAAEWLLFPAQFAMAFGFLLPASRLLRAMANSNLLPEYFEFNNTVKKQHYAVLLVMLISFLLCVLVLFLKIDLDNTPILFAQFTYISNLFAFYKLRTEFARSHNAEDVLFTNPFGIYGALYAAFIFALIAVSTIAFQREFFAICYFGGYWILLTFYYFYYAKTKQVFSEDEHRSLLVLHVMKNNSRKRKKKKATSAKPSQFTSSSTIAGKKNRRVTSDSQGPENSVTYSSDGGHSQRNDSGRVYSRSSAPNSVKDDDHGIVGGGNTTVSVAQAEVELPSVIKQKEEENCNDIAVTSTDGGEVLMHSRSFETN